MTTLSLRKPLAFVVKDFTDDTSYKLAFALRFTSVFFHVFVFYFLSRLVDSVSIPQLEIYGSNYFGFVFIGIAFTRFFSSAINSLRSYIQEAQLNGTLEALLATQTDVFTITLSTIIYPFLFTCMEIVVMFSLGVLLLDLDLFWGNLPTALVILILGLVSFFCIGIIAAGFIIVFKRGDPVTKIFILAGGLLGGELYPVSVLPEWGQKIAWLLPITHTLEGLRLALLSNYTLEQLAPRILTLLIFCVVLIPLSGFWFRWAIKRAKSDGSLSQY